VKRIKLGAIPPLFAAHTLEAITPDPARHAKQAAMFGLMRDEPQASYVLCGKHGCGKTLAGWLLYRQAVEAGKRAVGVTCSELLRQFRDWQFDSEKLPVVTPTDLRSNDSWFVLLDEIDKAKPSEFAAEQLFELVDAAYAYQQQIVITSNTPIEGLAAHWSRHAPTMGSAIVRRLMEHEGAILVDLF
jgi:DNA replication protein DnaC